MTIKVRIAQLVILVVAALGWELIAYYHLLSKYILPAPYGVAVTFFELFGPQSSGLFPGGVLPQLITTLTEIAGAVGIAVAIALPLGFAIGINQTVADTYEPILYLFYSIPAIVLYPVMYLLVGLGEPSKILFGAFLATFILAINTIQGLRQVQPQFFRLARSLRLSSRNTMVKVVIPAAAPAIVSGLRQALALAIVGVVAGEILASDRGLGFVIASSLTAFKLNVVYAVILLVLVIGFALTEVMRLLEGRFLAHTI